MERLTNYKLGIIGGMGPLASAKLYERIIEKTKAKCDQDHIELVLLNKCNIPDRSNYLLMDDKDGIISPLDYINEGIEDLVKLGCKYFIIPCNTAHAFKKGFKHLDKITFIDMIEEAKAKTKKLGKDIFVLCTLGTRKVNVYNDTFMKYPNMDYQKIISKVIVDTKAGINAYEELRDVIRALNAPVLLACTELSVYFDELKNEFDNVYDAMDILIDKIIEKCAK